MEATIQMATSRQLWALYLASGKAHDYRNENLTKEQASALLDEFNKKSGYKKESKPKAEKKPTPKMEAKANKFGVKVGDIFHMQWGWEQTNNDFFQVIALCGESSVRVREVHLKRIGEVPTCAMAADYTCALPQNGEMAEYPEQSTWIKDQLKGDLKKLKSWAADGVSNPLFAMEHHNAYHCSGKEIKFYESWYA